MLVLPFVLVAAGQPIFAQGPPSGAAPSASAAPSPIERIGPNQFRLGQIRVDTAAREISVTGHVNPNVRVLEFFANTTGGSKAYETVLTLDTDAVSFNAALMLIGMDKTHARLPKFKFDPMAPAGDAVEVWLECPGGQCERMRAEQVLFDRMTQKPVPQGTWVYTGSSFAPNGRYIADVIGVLVGFYNDPAPIIGFVADSPISSYGAIVINPATGLTPETPVKVTVKAAESATAR